MHPHTVSALIKPVSGSCNMRCAYCFYRDVSAHRELSNRGKMSLDTLEILVRKLLGTGAQMAYFSFQGGEPTLAGLDFFKAFLEFAGRCRQPQTQVQAVLQTNGLALNEEWAAFLAENHFLVGISLDGPRELHDRLRRTANDEETFHTVLKNIRLLEQYGVEYNILTVVTAAVARHPDSVYRTFRKYGFRYLQFIPCLDGLTQERGDNPYSLTPELYGGFLKRMFDHWFAHQQQGDPVYIRYFDNLLFAAAGRPVPACGMNGHCDNQMVIEADGSVYPCDFYVLDEYRLGSIVTDSFEALQAAGEESRFLREDVLPEKCRRCPYLPLCRGGCRRDRDHMGVLGENYFCPAFQDFFAYAEPRLRWLCRQILQNRP